MSPVPPWPDWLGPAPASTPGTSTALLPVSSSRPVLRVPDALGMPVVARLLGDCDDRLLLGPVLHHRLSRVTYWHVAPGATDEYPPGCRLLAADAYIAVPAPGAAFCTVARWIHLPDRERLSGPAWLAAALNTQHTNHRPSARSIPMATETPEPDRCAMCPFPPSAAGPVLRVGPGDCPVDLGHPDCLREASKGVRAAAVAGRVRA